MTAPAVGNGARFAARPLSHGGTPTPLWMAWVRSFPRLDLSACPGLVVVGAHPDDETLGLGGMIGALRDGGVPVSVVSVTDGGAAYPGLSRAERSRLELVRRHELHTAATILGVTDRVHLGLPDGELTDHEAWLSARLTALLAKHARGVWCAANWRGDGHPDHEAVGRAALLAARRTGAVPLQYPIWMWHWALPSDPAVPWSRARAVPLTDLDTKRKQAAAQCFRSQHRAPNNSVTPVLPPFVLRRLLAVGEVVFS
jgi:LmbE family N-acetylglucosaminyl deacetylase